MPKYPNGLVRSLLEDQYLLSEEAAERVWSRAQDRTEASDFLRARVGDEDIAIEHSELRNDALDFFSKHRNAMVDEYAAELRVRVGSSTQEEFCGLLADVWQSDHDSHQLRPLKASIRDYLLVEGNGNPPAVLTGHLFEQAQPCYGFGVIDQMLQATRCTLQKYIYLWLDTHPRGRMLGFHDVYFRRGVALAQQLPDGASFVEHDYLSSYSLSLSAAEKFARSSNGLTPAPTIFHSDYSTIETRAIFFSPFIAGMSIDQLELGVIPPIRPHRIRYKATYGGTHDYQVLRTDDWAHRD